MKILHVVPFLPKASGITTFVVECSDALQEAGVGQVVAVGDRLHFDVAPSRAGVPRMDVREVLARIVEFDVVHIHGIWPPFMHRFVTAARRHRLPIVWSLHGMLSPWARKFKWWKKLPAWWLWQKWDLQHAAVLHATSGREMEWVRACGFKNRLVNIPLGTNLPDAVSVRRHERKTLLYVGRINYIKALDRLIRAWAMVRAKGWTLRIVGLDEMNCQAGLVRLVKELGVTEAVEFPGPRFGKDLDAEYQNADALVLPSFTENFGGVVVDALAWGLPVITSKGTPWSEVAGQSNNQTINQSQINQSQIPNSPCGWWVDNAPEALAKAIREMMSLSDAERRAMGARGRQLAAEKYAWPAVVGQLREIYEEMARGRRSNSQTRENML